MPSASRRPRRILAALVLAAACGGATLPAEPTLAASAKTRASCEIDVTRKGGVVALTALAHAETKVSGSYSLEVSGRGTQIRQGGPFVAEPGRPATLGTVTLSPDRTGHDAELELAVGRETIRCSQRIRGGL